MTEPITSRAAVAEDESLDMFRLLVDGVRDYAIFALDTEGYIRSWNAGAQRTKQYTASEIIGQHFSIFYTPEDRAAKRPQYLLELSKREGRVEDEGWRVRKDGTHFWADVILTALYDKNGIHRGFAKVTRDMTERRNLILALEEAVRASQAKTAFLANMSHELRTPLTAIIGYAEMINDQLEDNSVIGEDVNRILYSARHLQSIVSDILDLSKIEAGKLEIHWEEVNLQDVLLECTETIKPLARCNGNEVAYEITPTLTTIISDRVRLRQVLYNLLSNAARFTHDGLITVKARQGVAANNPAVHLDVIDTGIGMTEEQARMAFERFHQVEGHSAEFGRGGTGLGLAICRMLCLAMGGSISVQSTVGKGSTFTVTLPITAADDTAG